MFPKYAQHTCESCLAVCLLLLVQKIKARALINSDLELETLISALKLSKLNFVIGHLHFITKRFHVKAELYVNDDHYYRFVKKLSKSSSISLKVEKISLKFLDKILSHHPIIYIDDYILRNVVHYPHFVIVFSKNNSEYMIFDPWDGKEKLVKRTVLAKGIRYLKKYLNFTPQVIIIK
jgi:hypothetical protein